MRWGEREMREDVSGGERKINYSEAERESKRFWRVNLLGFGIL